MPKVPALRTLSSFSLRTVQLHSENCEKIQTTGVSDDGEETSKISTFNEPSVSTSLLTNCCLCMFILHPNSIIM